MSDLSALVANVVDAEVVVHVGRAAEATGDVVVTARPEDPPSLRSTSPTRTLSQAFRDYMVVVLDNYTRPQPPIYSLSTTSPLPSITLTNSQLLRSRLFFRTPHPYENFFA
jgi:hypothetical protein